MTKSFKMVVLEVLLEREALGAGLRLDELARRSHAYLVRFPELMRDTEGVRELPEPRTPDPATWLAYWRKNPIAAWAGDEGEGRRWFAVEGERFVPRLPACIGDEATLAAMTREVVDWRLARYVRSARAGDEGNGFECVVLSNRRDPILKLPSRAQRPDLPSGETDVRTPDGAVWRFRFKKEFCNVARPVAAGRNELPDLLRRWFGPSAGRPGTGFRVRFSRSPDGWWVEPAGSRAVETAPRGRVVMFPSLRAAAGSPVAQAETVADAPPAEWVTLPVERAAPGRFAVRAVGDSMDGGPEPIRDGDWLVMRWARGASLESLEGRVILIELRDAAGEAAHQVKRLVREGRSWMLRSDNPAAPSFEASADCVPVAVLEGKVTPEGIAPAVGERIVEDRLAAAFGLTTPPRDGRVEGHLFALVTDRGTFVEPDRLRLAVPDRRPGETAFVLTRAPGEEAWRYAGVARWSEEEALWTCPPLDSATWRALGQGRSASRRLPPGVLDEAASDVNQVLRDVGEGAWIERDGKRLRVAGAAENGGLRIDGGPGGFRERTLSLVDVAWVLVARRDVERNGGVLDEARVNRLRYLEGTPKGATRWIDTGWAVIVSEAALRHPRLIRA